MTAMPKQWLLHRKAALTTPHLRMQTYLQHTIQIVEPGTLTALGHNINTQAMYKMH